MTLACMLAWILSWTSVLDSPRFLIVAALVVILVMIMSSGSRQKRELSRAENKVCDACGSGHPTFAVFCRKCGKKL